MFRPKKFRKTFTSLKVRNYRLYFVGQVISTTGTWMQVLGQVWLVLKITNSGTALGLVISLQWLPVLLVGAWAGVIVDRFPRRTLLYITQVASGLLAVILGILVATNTVTLWMVYVLALALGVVNAIDNPARQTFITEMVEKEHLTSAVSLNSIQLNLTRIIGPALAALMIASTGLASLFFFNAVSYVAVIIALAMMNLSELYIIPPLAEGKGQLMEGLRYVKNSPTILMPLLLMAIIGTLTYEFSVSLPLFAQFTWHGNAATYAEFTAALGIGAILGGIATATQKRPNGAALVRAALFFGISTAIVALSPNLLFALIAVVVAGFFSVNFLSLGNIILQLESAPEMRGRVMALWGVAFLGSTPVGAPIIGWVSQHYSPRAGLALGGVAAVLAALLGVYILKRAEKKITGTV